MNRVAQETSSHSQELRLLADLSPTGGSAGPVSALTFETETGAGGSDARRARPRGRSHDQASSSASGSATAAASATSAALAGDEPRREKHAAAKEPTDVKKMEADLLALMQAFNSGSLRAFGRDVSTGHMERIREQQERLARLHFEMGAQQELFPPLSEEGLGRAAASLRELMSQLQQLSVSIEKLHTRPEAAEPPG